MKHKLSLSIFFLVFIFLKCSQPPIKIDVWYGQEQTFGKPGNAQRWINILGSVDTEYPLAYLGYSLNQSKYKKLSIGQDMRRLAREGDFNIDIHRSKLKQDENIILIKAIDSLQNEITKEVIINYYPGNQWPLPYSVKWSGTNNIQDKVQVIDGKWKITNDGIRTVEPYYDRVIGFGDSTWRDYEVKTTVTYHSFTPPVDEPPTFGVSHAAIAMRWPGHEYDDRQPHIEWNPLGATCEFKTSHNHEGWRWRMLKPSLTEDKSRNRYIEFNKPYHMKARVESVNDTSSIYSAKLWPVGTKEPSEWDLQGFEANDDVQSGSALLLAHHTDVTFGDITVIPLK